MPDGTLILTDQQKEAVEKAVSFVCEFDEDFDDAFFSISGYAGTGKTTVLKEIIKELEKKKLYALPCAFTGKAALRMRQKGVSDANTIHSSIYNYSKYTNTYHLRNAVEGDYFLIDEASMISKDLWEDILTFCLPIVLVGDGGQLEPVGDDPKLMRKADIVLDKIHRQAEKSEIIQFATSVRLKNPKSFARNRYVKDVILMRGSFSHDKMHKADIIICGYNDTRIETNNEMRSFYGYDGLLVPGEKIICLMNNQSKGFFNGQILTVSEILEDKEETLEVKVKDDLDNETTVLLWKAQFNNKKLLARGKKKVTQNGKERWVPLIPKPDRYLFCDYGYCITCHKSQGSEWDKVLVIDEQCPKLWESARWRYTAITRAAKELYYVL
jgi:exodeoxyribonuclease-5